MTGERNDTMANSATNPLLTEGTIDLPASDAFVVRDAVALGTSYGEFTVTYVGPNFLRLFGNVEVAEVPARTVRHYTLGERTQDAQLSAAVGPDGSLADLFAVLRLGADGPGRFTGESVTVYQFAEGARWTPHYYTRGTRLGFGALPWGDEVGWEQSDVFIARGEA